MKTMLRTLGSAVVLAVFGLVAGCAMSPKAEAPATEAAPAQGAPGVAPAEPEGEPQTLADAEARLERARADLNLLALNERLAAPTGAAAAPPPASVTMAPAPSPAPAREEARRADKSSASSADSAPAPVAAPAPAKDANTCQTACKAFSSLARASDAVCRLDTEGGKRCERARQIREDASQRVASCGCSK
jgi:hypothetical protein